MRIVLSTTVFTCAIALAGCAADDIDAPTNLGHLDIPLSTVGGDGQTYVLQNAIIDINGPANLSIVDSQDSVADVMVPEGDYTLTLRDGWNLAILHADGTTAPVDAVLACKNPLPVRVEATLFTSASFQFLRGSDDGTLGIGFGVTSNPGLLTGKVHVTSDFSWDGGENSSNVENGFTGLQGQDVDVRLRFGVIDSSTTSYADGSSHRIYYTTPVRVGFSGDVYTSYLAGELATRLTGNLLGFQLSYDPVTAQVTAELQLSDMLPDGSFVVTGMARTAMPFVGLDAGGFPTLTPGYTYRIDTDTFYVERYQKMGDVSTRTGSMSGPATLYLQVPTAP
jgi:hypothetical protein